MKSRSVSTSEIPTAGNKAIVLIALLLTLIALSACSSSNSGNDNNATDAEDLEDSDPVPVLPSTLDPETPEVPDPATDNPPTDSTPIDLLLTEIRLAAAMPVLVLNDKLSSGQTLTEQEQSCIENLNIASGEQLKSVNCETPWVAADTILSVTSATFENTSQCDESLSLGSVEGCALQATEMGFRLEWVVTTTEPEPNGPIGSLQPVAGTLISYNNENSGTVTLNEASPVTGTFNCEIDIGSASLLTDQSRGNCQREIGRTLSRLFELRTGG
ncbi:MAG: hypothetical protein KTR32_24345 [Granulosicoccus sp.]|nr:hypothetical protein [Granulosicoccus sp.]